MGKTTACLSMPTAQCVQRHLRAIHQLFIGAWVVLGLGSNRGNDATPSLHHNRI